MSCGLDESDVGSEWAVWDILMKIIVLLAVSSASSGLALFSGMLTNARCLNTSFIVECPMAIERIVEDGSLSTH